VFVAFSMPVFNSISGKVLTMEYFTKLEFVGGFFGLFVLVMIVLVTWRRLGAGLQRWVTTRRPSDRQLGRAIEVGEELLEAVRSRPGARTGMARRVWNSGFLQVLIGFTAVALVVEYGGPLLSHWWRWLTG